MEYTEILKLDKLLTEAGLPHLTETLADGWKIWLLPDAGGWWQCDAIQHKYSYGGTRGLIEIMGFPLVDGGDVEGWLTAEQVLEKVKEASV